MIPIAIHSTPNIKPRKSTDGYTQNYRTNYANVASYLYQLIPHDQILIQPNRPVTDIRMSVVRIPAPALSAVVAGVIAVGSATL